MGESSAGNVFVVVVGLAAGTWLLLRPRAEVAPPHAEAAPASIAVSTKEPDQRPTSLRYAMATCGGSIELPAGAQLEEPEGGGRRITTSEGPVAVSVVCLSPGYSSPAASLKGHRDQFAQKGNVISDEQGVWRGVSGGWRRSLRVADAKMHDIEMLASPRYLVFVERQGDAAEISDKSRKSAQDIAATIQFDVPGVDPSSGAIAGNGYDPGLGYVPPTYVAPMPNYAAPNYGLDDHAKPVPVRGYIRSNGTYVAPYDRAAPGGGSRHR